MRLSHLALFDLDHTLIDFDSGMAWCEVHERAGRLPPGSHARYLACCQAYVRGEATLLDLHRLLVRPLNGLPADTLHAWQAAFSAAMAPCMSPWALDLVNRHRQAGHPCVLVTATSRLIAEPLARLLGLHHTLATEPALSGDGDVQDMPCWGSHKVARVEAWLSQHDHGGLSDMTSWFYSDAYSDLPLLQSVTHPVAVQPDGRLRAHARARGWPIVERGEARD